MTYNRCMAKRDDDLEFSVNAAFDEARAVIDKVPLYLVNGSLGSGKTSVLEFLLQQSDYKGARVIENEYANENVDGYRLEGLAEMVTTRVWGYRNASDTRLVNVYVQRLRAKIEKDPEKPQIVLTVRGVGYKTGE